MDTTLRSVSQSSLTAIEQNDSPSSPQIDKDDTNLSFYSMRDEGEIGETISSIPAPTPSPRFPSTPFSEDSSEQIYGTQVNVDELDGNKAQLAYPLSDGTNASQLPPLVPVRRHSQSHLNGRTQSATTSPPIAQNTSIKASHVPSPATSAAPRGRQLPSQYSQESYRVPIAQTPQTQTSFSSNISAPSPRRSGDSWNSRRSLSLTPQQYPPQQSAPTTPSMYSEITSQPYGPGQSVETPQPHSSGPTQPSIPQSVPPQSYTIQNVHTPQASRSVYEETHQRTFPQSAPTQSYRLPTSQGQPMYAGVSQPFISQTSGLPIGHVPSRKPLPDEYPHHVVYNSIGQTTAPQTSRKANAFVASDPFRVTHQNERVDAPSDGLTFDDIPTAGRPPGPALARPSRSYSLPAMPTQSRYAGEVHQSYSLPNRPIPQGQPIGTPQQFIPQPRFHNIPNAPTPQAQPIHSGTPPQSYSLPNRPTPYASQPIYTGTPQQFIPQQTPPQFHGIPIPPAPQAQPIHAGIPQPPQIPGSFPGASYVRPAPYFTGYNPTPHVIKPPPFVANDPFQMNYGGAVVDVPSNFDDISTARSSPEPSMAPYGAPPRQPAYGGYYYPGTARPYAGAYGQDQISSQPGAYPTFDDERPWYQPDSHRHRRSSSGNAYANARPPDAQVSSHPGAYPTFTDERPWYQPDIHRPRRSSPPNTYDERPWYQPDTHRPRRSSPANAYDERPRYRPDYYRRRRSSSPNAYANVPLPDAPPIIVMPKDDRHRRRHRPHRQQTPPTPQEDIDLAQPHLPPIPGMVGTAPMIIGSPSSSRSRSRSPRRDAPMQPVIQPALPASRSPSRSRSPRSPPRSPRSPRSPLSPPRSPLSHRRYGSYAFDPHLPYSLYPPYMHPQYQYNPPKKSFFSRLFRSSHRTYPRVNPQPFTAIYPQPFTEPYTVIYPPMDPGIDWHKAVVGFFLVGFPRQMYLLLLLRLPSLYFSRVARIFEEADMSLPEIKKMALETASQGLTHEYEMEMAFESSSVPPVYKRLTSTWEFFIDSVMREWKTFNIISVLLLSAILTILQIESAADDPLTRYTALFSLMCALISLLFGCMYIIRFGSMRKSYKAAEWALEAKRSKTLIWWNVWILLAMPAIWLTWSIVLYIVCIMSFIWRTGVTSTTPPGLSNTGLLIIRIVMSVVLGIGILYGLLIMTTFKRYGMVMDKAWKQRIDEWVAEKTAGNMDSYAYPTMDDRPYSPPHRHTGRSSRYRRRSHSQHYQPSSGDRYNAEYIPPSPHSSTPSYKSYTYAPGPVHVPPTIIQLPPGSPHSAPSTKSDDASTITRPLPNKPVSQPDSRVPQSSLGGTTSAAKPEATHPTPNRNGAEELPPRLIPERTLYPIVESSITSPSEDGDNALGFSSGLKNRSSGDDDAPDDGNRVRFRLPSGSSDISDDWQGIIAPRKTHPRKTPKR